MKRDSYYSGGDTIVKFILVLLLMLTSKVHAQELNDFGFTRSYDQPLVFNNSQLLPYAWAGGMNACQFSTIDLNFDGIKDLFVFDRIGNRILPYLNTGTPQSVSYTLAPQLAGKFPPVTGWVALRDYNCDGKEDLFTYGGGGIRIYKNTSDAVNGLSFELVTNQLLSLMFGNYINIFLTEVDYPAIDDIDGDGDLDILTFWIIGTYIHYHRNMSMEKFGTCDSLDYRLESQCWGFIREGDTSNYITLHAPCPFKDTPPLPAGSAAYPDDIEHIGSTFLTLDLNNDQVKDLLLGDVDFPDIIGLINGGDADSAHMISQDDHYPSYDTSVNLYSFPVCANIDVDNDNRKDLLVSPFDPNILITESDHSVWQYKDVNIAGPPLFRLQSKSFLQGGMIDVGTSSYPVVCDVDQDGLTDIMVGNFGYHDSSYYVSGFLHSVFRSRLMWLRNDGTPSSPHFVVADTNFAGIASMNLTMAYPAFGDLDGDGDLDMLLGNSNGKLYYFENQAGAGNPLSFAPPVPDYQGIDAGDASTPQIWDLDNDGVLDLIIGNKKGTLHYYHNTGTTQNPVFQYITDSLGKVDVRDAFMSWEGYSVPCFFKTAGDTSRLFLGSLKGGLSYYKGIDGNLADTFTEVSQDYLYLKDGTNSSVAVFNFDNDAYPDMVMGNTCGGLAYYKGSVPLLSGIPSSLGQGTLDVSVYPNPANDECWVECSSGQRIHDLSYALYTMDARFVAGNRLNANPSRIPLHLVPGVYLMQLSARDDRHQNIKSRPLRLVIVRK